LDGSEKALPVHAGKPCGLVLPSFRLRQDYAGQVAGRKSHVEGIMRQAGFWLSPQHALFIFGF